MSVLGYSANYFNDKDKKLYVATQILSSLVVRGGMDKEKAVDIALKYTNRLLCKLEEEERENENR